MSEERVYSSPKEILENSNISESEFEALYEESLKNPDEFWSKQADIYLDWDEKWTKVKETNIKKGEIAWFKGGKLNASVNCIDRHLPENGEKIAFIWEGDAPEESKNITYQELHDEVCKFSNVLKARGVKKGDRVCIYMPMIPEATYAMLACTRIGAIHSVVFGGFSPESLKDRILDSDCQTVITADEGLRGGKKVPLKENVDIALEGCPKVHTVLVVTRTGTEISWNEDCDIRYEEISKDINKSDIDKVFVKGKQTIFTYKRLIKNKRGNILQNIEDIDLNLKNFISNNDCLMIKGSNATGLNDFSKNIIKGI